MNYSDSPWWVDPYYRPHAHTIRAWLDGYQFGGNSLRLPKMDLNPETGGPPRIREPEDVLVRQQAQRVLPPAPRTDGYGYYWWEVAEDIQGRRVCSGQRFKLIYVELIQGEKFSE